MSWGGICAEEGEGVWVLVSGLGYGMVGRFSAFLRGKAGIQGVCGFGFGA